MVWSVEISLVDSEVRRGKTRSLKRYTALAKFIHLARAELVRQTKQDPELEYIRQTLLTNQLGNLPEPYRSVLPEQLVFPVRTCVPR